MKAAGADYKFINYPGAVHNFINPGAEELGRESHMPVSYNVEADKQSWEELKKLLKAISGQ